MPMTGTLGAKLYTSATPMTNIDLEVIEDIDSLEIDVEVGLIESFEEFGRVYEKIVFERISDGRAVKFKGGYDEGNFSFTMIQDLTDNQGQRLLKLYAEASDQNTYPFKIVLSGVDEEFEAIYFGAKIMSFRTLMGGVNNVIRAKVNLR